MERNRRQLGLARSRAEIHESLGLVTVYAPHHESQPYQHRLEGRCLDEANSSNKTCGTPDALLAESLSSPSSMHPLALCDVLDAQYDDARRSQHQPVSQLKLCMPRTLRYPRCV